MKPLVRPLALLLMGLLYVPCLTASSIAQTLPPTSTAVANSVVHYRTVQIAGTGVFYREAGPADAPVLLLLHGFPTSSHMFRNLIPALSDRYHVTATM